MYDFKEMLLLDDKALQKKLSEMDSSVLTDYLRNCNDDCIKNEYYKRIDNIFGENYFYIFKLAVEFKNKISLKKVLVKYSLFLFNILFSSYICKLILLIIGKAPLEDYFEIDFTLLFVFIFAILPQIILFIIMYILNRLIKINKIINIFINIILIIVLGITMSYKFISLFSRGNFIESILRGGYAFYISFIIGGIIHRLFLYIINKINIRE